MATLPMPSCEQALDFAVAAIKRGDPTKGQAALAWVLKREPNNVVAWLWLAECTADAQVRQECLARVSELNPFM